MTIPSELHLHTAIRRTPLHSHARSCNTSASAVIMHLHLVQRDSTLEVVTSARAQGREGGEGGGGTYAWGMERERGGVASEYRGGKGG